MGELLNLIGFSTGLVLYAMLLLMVLRAGVPSLGRSGPDPLLVATAVLGIIWNVCALPAYELPRLGVEGPFSRLDAAGYIALGFLPAVVVHSVLRRGQEDKRAHGQRTDLLRRGIVITAYALSALAALLQFRAMVGGGALPSPPAMQILTYAYVGLLVPLAAATRGQSGSRRALWAVALAIFAVSTLHLGEFHQGELSWPVELLGHHASLPLAIAILYQDYPFAFADLFLKRALTLLALVATAFVATVNVAGLLGRPGTPGMAGVGILVTLWVATALLYPRLRELTSWFVNAVVLARPNYEALRATLTSLAQQHDRPEPLLDAACAALAPALNARIVRWREISSDEREVPFGELFGTSRSLAARVEIPVAEPPRYVLEVAELTGGRRLLSDDRGFLETIASVLGRRIDTIRLTHERYERELREREIGRLATEAELRALRSQINPHFLFNALTTIGYLIQTAPTRALDTLLRLTSLLRGVLRSEGELSTLGREVELVEAYLDIERARFEERLRVRIDVPDTLRNIRIPPLLLQPLVENAVKHGIGPERDGGEIVVSARVEAAHGVPLMLSLRVSDTGAGVSPSQLQRGRASGVGLNNIERRLAGQYGQRAGLTLTSTPGHGTIVEIRMPAEPAPVDVSALEATG